MLRTHRESEQPQLHTEMSLGGKSETRMLLSCRTHRVMGLSSGAGASLAVGTAWKCSNMDRCGNLWPPTSSLRDPQRNMDLGMVMDLPDRRELSREESHNCSVGESVTHR